MIDSENTIFPIASSTVSLYPAYEFVILNLHYIADPTQKNPELRRNFALSLKQARQLMKDLQDHIVQLESLES